MAAYIIAEVEVTNPQEYETYRTQVPAVIQEYGGRYLVRGGRTEHAEGMRPPNRIVVMEFADMTALRRFYDSEDYSPLKAIREGAARSEVVFVEGV